MNLRTYNNLQLEAVSLEKKINVMILIIYIKNNNNNNITYRLILYCTTFYYMGKCIFLCSFFGFGGVDGCKFVSFVSYGKINRLWL